MILVTKLFYLRPDLSWISDPLVPKVWVNFKSPKREDLATYPFDMFKVAKMENVSYLTFDMLDSTDLQAGGVKKPFLISMYYNWLWLSDALTKNHVAATEI